MGAKRKGKKLLNIKKPMGVIILIIVIVIIIYLIALLTQSLLLHSTYGLYTNVYKELGIGIAPFTQWIDDIKADVFTTGRKYNGSPINPFGDIITLLGIRKNLIGRKPSA